MSSRFETYLENYQRWPTRGLSGRLVDKIPIFIIIPAYDESDLQHTLHSLLQCERLESPMHVVIILNAPETERDQYQSRYQRDAKLLEHYWKRHSGSNDRLDVLEYYFSERWAGVGAARKAGMDEVIAHLYEEGCSNALIASLDADCTVADNYLTCLERAFRAQSMIDVWSIYFEHNLADCDDALHRKHIYLFELHLRYYRQAQKWCGFPFAFHTIGSCMAFQAASYAKFAGMNRKKAGEDFYFFQKLASHGSAADLTDTCVYPSARISDRTPFGTGRAIAEQYETDAERKTFSLNSFEALRTMFNFIREYEQLMQIDSAGILDEIHPLLAAFLSHQDFDDDWRQLKEHATDNGDLRNRFYQWMGGGRLLKWLHYTRNRDWPDQPVREQARHLLYQLQIEAGSRDLLTVYRRLDREGR